MNTRWQKTTRIPIERPARYGKQLASHLGRKEGSEETASGWLLRLRGAETVIQPRDGELLLTVDAPTDESLIAVMDVLDRHLRRFAAPLELDIEWHEVEG